MSTTLPVPQSNTAQSGSTLASPQAERRRLIVVGGGMAAHGLCRTLAQNGSPPLEIIVFGEEPHLAYDRVNLSKLFENSTKEDLLLSDQAWYDEHQIRFETQCRIQEIDRQAKQVVDEKGKRHSYDQLVLATGSHAWVPPIPGADSPGVFVYRTLDDLARIEDHVRSHGCAVGAVIGGGLLGLEAAKVLHDLGLQTSVIEMAPGLMPRQLDAIAATRLKSAVEALGVDVHLVRRTQSIEALPNEKLKIHYHNAPSQPIDVLIIAAGVKPNDQLAKAAQLEVAPRGGIVVDRHMQTSDPDIFGIGECVCFADHVYGLVAPCYRMADVLAGRLRGQDIAFEGADESAELKLMGVQVVTLGRAIGQSTSGIVVSQQDDAAYRKLIIEQGKIVGAACVGPWEELPQVRQAVQNHQILWPLQRIRFRRTGSPWGSGGALPVSAWPDDALVCSCIGVTRGQISHVIQAKTNQEAPATQERQSTTLDQIVAATRATTACGNCQSLVCELAGSHQSDQAATKSAKTMLVASVFTAIAVSGMLVAAPLEMATSVQDSWRQIDFLWRNDFPRQVTGYTTLALMILGLLFSFRKRWKRFSWGKYSFWRTVHGVLGAATLVSVAVHTGLRMGENLNFFLSAVFLAVAGLGALAGIASSWEARATGSMMMLVRQWRPRLTQLHIWLFWPLPVLILLHVLSFYWFTD